MEPRRLTRETFYAVTEMVVGHLRIKDADRWSEHVCKLKYLSFIGEFPEVGEAQFMWAAEQWIQACGPGFTRFPTWKELMAPLYRTENGLANRSWGFREVGNGAGQIPAFCAPMPEQLALLPATPASISPAADPHNAAAYVPFTATDHPLLPPAADEPPMLTEEKWQAYLKSIHESSNQQGRTSEDSGERPEDREVVGVPVQQARTGAGSPKRSVSGRTPSVH